MAIQIIPIQGLPIIKRDDDLAEYTVQVLAEKGLEPMEKDVYVYSHVIVSRSEGKQVDLEKVRPSQRAKNYAALTEKDPRLVEVILRESRSLRRISSGVFCCCGRPCTEDKRPAREGRKEKRLEDASLQDFQLSN